MITTNVSAIKGLVLSALGGYSGERGKLWLWLWNLVPIQAYMPDSDISKKNCRASDDMLGLPFFVVRENLCRVLVKERDLDL